MPHRHLSPFQRRARQLLGRSVYVRVPSEVSSEDPGVAGAARRSILAIAYTGVRRPCICTGCICLTPSERARQKRVFALARAYASVASRHA